MPEGDAAVKPDVKVKAEVLPSGETKPSMDNISWVCVGFFAVLLGGCIFAYIRAKDNIYEDLLVGIVLVLTQYLMMSMCAVAVVGMIMGRPRWWARPYCTGFIGFGDGSAEKVGAEIAMEKAGMVSFSKDLYFDSTKWVKVRPSSAAANPPAPVATPTPLSAQHEPAGG